MTPGEFSSTTFFFFSFKDTVLIILVFKLVSTVTFRKFLQEVFLCSSICRTIAVRCAVTLVCVSDCVCHAHASRSFWICRVGSLVLSKGPLQHLAKSCPAEVFQQQTIVEANMCSVTELSLFLYYKETGRPGESREKLSFAKLAFMSFLFPELHC